ncbi:hypothetical protein Agub_g2617 [Astrephomene gubernaculifera]|uniref:DNA endonuclease activator Ctp1 C-terminal domain-containing protein n=1 Tax=Astrephomene gubernaculifera TaxID=47775 RepID=A0AAD3HHT5_9CHLO|nr:hypothetical protein Agub_g2617 [Astrephomene gubernaculifera]
MALPEVHAAAVEAQGVVQAAVEVLNRLSVALGPSNQLTGAWLQERDVLYARQRQLEQDLGACQRHAESQARECHNIIADQTARIEQLEGHAGELQATVDSLRAGTDAAQLALNTERQQLAQLRLQLERQQQELQAQQQQQQRQYQRGDQHQRQQRTPGAGDATTPRSDSDASLPPSQPRIRIDRVPETLFIGWHDDPFADALGDGGDAAPAANAAGAETAAAAAATAGASAEGRRACVTPGGGGRGYGARGSGGDDARVPHLLALPGPSSSNIGGVAGACAHEAKTGYPEAVAEAVWAVREQQLTQDYAAQLQAVWAENSALQADLAAALAYRRTAQQLRDRNQALEEQLQELQQQLREAREAAAAAAVAPCLHTRVSVATSPLPDAEIAPSSPAFRPLEGGDMTGPDAAAEAAQVPVAALDAGAARAAGAGALVATDHREDEAQLREERDKYLCKYSEAKQACREARQLARHWQSAYWGLMVSYEGVEAAQDAKRRMQQAEQTLGTAAAVMEAVAGVAATGAAMTAEEGPSEREGDGGHRLAATTGRGGADDGDGQLRVLERSGVADTTGSTRAQLKRRHGVVPVFVKEEPVEPGEGGVALGPAAPPRSLQPPGRLGLAGGMQAAAAASDVGRGGGAGVGDGAATYTDPHGPGLSAAVTHQHANPYSLRADLLTRGLPYPVLLPPLPQRRLARAAFGGEPPFAGDNAKQPAGLTAATHQPAAAPVTTADRARQSGHVGQEQATGADTWAGVTSAGGGGEEGGGGGGDDDDEDLDLTQEPEEGSATEAVGSGRKAAVHVPHGGAGEPSTAGRHQDDNDNRTLWPLQQHVEPYPQQQQANAHQQQQQGQLREHWLQQQEDECQQGQEDVIQGVLERGTGERFGNAAGCSNAGRAGPPLQRSGSGSGSLSGRAPGAMTVGLGLGLTPAADGMGTCGTAADGLPDPAQATGGNDSGCNVKVGAQGGVGGGGGGVGWLSKRSRSWDGDAGGTVSADGGAGLDGSRGAGGRAGRAGTAAGAVVEEKLQPGKRLVQMQLPYGKQRCLPQQVTEAQRRQQRQQVRQSWHLDQDSVEAAGRAAAAGSRNAMHDQGAGTQPRPVKLTRSESEDDSDAIDVIAARRGNGGGASTTADRVTGAPPPLKRKALGSANASTRGSTDGGPSADACAVRAAAPVQQPAGAAVGLPPRPLGPPPPAPLQPQQHAVWEAGTATEGAAVLAEGSGAGGADNGGWGDAAPAPSSRAVGARPGAAAPAAAAAAAAAGGGGGGAGRRPGEPGYKYSAVIRGRAEREDLQAIECAGCRAFYEAIATWGDAVAPCCNHVQNVPAGAGKAAGGRGAAAGGGSSAAAAAQQQQQQQPGNNIASALRQAGGRHRFKYAPPATPEGFWDIGFGDDTQD